MVMLVELQATCSALGYQEGKKYVKEPDCLGMIFHLRYTVQLNYTETWYSKFTATTKIKIPFPDLFNNLLM